MTRHRHRWAIVGPAMDTGNGALRGTYACECGAIKVSIAYYAVGRSPDSTFIHAAGTPEALRLHPSY